jgi:predicted transcriptional regulator
MTIPFELQMIDRVSGVQLFSHRFREDIKLEPTLISGFISAVITFAEEIKPSEGKEIIKYIDRGDFVLQVEPGQHVIGLLILSSKDYSFKEKLKILVNEFETRYKKEIVNWNGFSSCFLEFEEQVKQMISKKPLSPYHIPQLVNSDRPPQKIDDMKWAIITHINGQNDINTISEKLDLSVEVVQSIIAYFEETGLVQTHFKITDNSVIELTKKGLLSLEVGSDDYNEVISYVGEDAIKVLSIIGNERSIAEIKTEVPLNHMKITELIEKLVSDRYLEILPQ